MNVELRKVCKKDWDFILKLRNDKEHQTNYYNSHTISKKEHYDYLNKQKNNPNFSNWIICNDNNDVGYVRILDNDISIFIDKKYHNKGIGTLALNLVEQEARKLGIKKLVGKVMLQNEKSKKIFLKNGYKTLMYWLEKDIS